MPPRRRTILFVEDEPFFNRGMREELEEAGYRVIPISGSGTEALEVMESMLKSGIAFDLIILDIMMPTGDRIDDPKGGRRTGVKLCERIRWEMGLKVPIIFLTVIEDEAVHSYLEKIEKEAGLEPTILVKPVAPLDLLDEVRDLIGGPF